MNMHVHLLNSKRSHYLLLGHDNLGNYEGLDHGTLFLQESFHEFFQVAK